MRNLPFYLGVILTDILIAVPITIIGCIAVNKIYGPKNKRYQQSVDELTEAISVITDILNDESYELSNEQRKAFESVLEDMYIRLDYLMCDHY